MTRVISFVVEVQSITESESRELVDEITQRDDISDVGETDTEEFEYTVSYDGIPRTMTYSQKDSTLSISVPFWEEGQRPRDQWLGGGTVDGLVDFLQHFSEFRDTIQTATDKQVIAEPRERRY
jgi:hypothetical protein